MFPKRDVKGHIVVSVPFDVKIGGETFTETYETGGHGFHDQICDIEDKHDIEFSEDEKISIKESVRAAVDAEREKIQQEVDEVLFKHDPDKVDQILVAKIYPSNVQDVAPIGAQQQWLQQKYNLPYRANSKAEQEEKMKEGLEELKTKIAAFVFQPDNNSSVGYGPVLAENMFSGGASASN